ncbi:MAG: pirin family protein [Planctomycetes bacterium]|nr:pirin family protein [Planctomycetota bacterium]
MAERRLARILAAAGRHWVGDGFPVQTLFSYHEGPDVSPFLLLDHAGPAHFPPAARRRGVGPHPHRGFETVTIVLQGEVEHRDSAGHGGTIGPGDVQWMTAASGLVHEEMHSDAFTRTGGTLEMVQLWVNLPARHKGARPGYQDLRAAQIPHVALPGGELRVIAGAFAAARGPARTFTPIELWDLDLRPGAGADLAVPAGHTTLLLALRGTLRLADHELRPGQIALYERAGTGLRAAAGGDGARALLLAGAPIDEPVVGHGPFVMNTPAEIRQAIADYEQGRMGTLGA